MISDAEVLYWEFFFYITMGIAPQSKDRHRREYLVRNKRLNL
ncbi:hypothetical protein N181_24200 [Sinorhizobium fredii USDA 205]|nr:hypothetical protein N181_24200 [Sinorhizobium fredii USDA 205]